MSMALVILYSLIMIPILDSNDQFYEKTGTCHNLSMNYDSDFRFLNGENKILYWENGNFHTLSINYTFFFL